MPVDPSNLPVVPVAMRPKPLYIQENLPREVLDACIAKGWAPQDVRLIADRAEAIKAVMEGVRHGTIEMGKDVEKMLALEAKAAGMLSVKGSEDGTNTTLPTDDLDDILAFGSPNGLEIKDAPGQTAESLPSKKGRGRPKKEKPI